MTRGRREALWYAIAWALLIGVLYANHQLKELGARVILVTQATGILALLLLMMVAMWTAGLVRRELDRADAADAAP